MLVERARPILTNRVPHELHATTDARPQHDHRSARRSSCRSALPIRCHGLRGTRGTMSESSLLMPTHVHRDGPRPTRSPGHRTHGDEHGGTPAHRRALHKSIDDITAQLDGAGRRCHRRRARSLLARPGLGPSATGARRARRRGDAPDQQRKLEARLQQTYGLTFSVWPAGASPTSL